VKLFKTLSIWYGIGTIPFKQAIMKKLVILMVLITGLAINSNAQVNISINIGRQPAWGPTGYDHVDYYYLPDANAYYDVGNRMFWWPDGRYWRSGPALPGMYHVDLYRVHKVVINNVRQPWLHNDRYYKQYHGYTRHYDQVAIRDGRDRKYWQNPGHPNYGQWQRDNGRGRGNYGYPGHGRGHEDHGRGHGNGHGNGHGRGR